MQESTAVEPPTKTTAIVAFQPVLTAVVAFCQGILHAVDAASLPRAETLELVFALPWLLSSILLYWYTLPFVVALLLELGRAGATLPRRAIAFGVVALAVQASYLVWPMYRVLGPETFEELLFVPNDVVVPIVAGVATLGYLSDRDALTALPLGTRISDSS